eukprot:2621145-Amphidinium_carterae.1
MLARSSIVISMTKRELGRRSRALQSLFKGQPPMSTCLVQKRYMRKEQTCLKGDADGFALMDMCSNRCWHFIVVIPFDTLGKTYLSFTINLGSLSSVRDTRAHTHAFKGVALVLFVAKQRAKNMVTKNGSEFFLHYMAHTGEFHLYNTTSRDPVSGKRKRWNR